MIGIAVVVVAVILAGAALVAVLVTKSPAFSAIAGLWTMSAGTRTTLWRQRTWQVLGGALYVPHYVGKSPMAAALTELAIPTSVEEAAWVCMEHALDCVLYDLHGREIATVNPHGAVRARRQRGGDLDDARYMPRYFGAKAAERLTRMAVLTSVDEAVADCLMHGVRCELFDAREKVIATIEADGTVRVPPRRGSDA